MTAVALRRLADSKLADAASLEGDADRLRAQAAALRGLLDPLVSISQRVWMGPAATDFEEKARQKGQQVDDQAAGLTRIAAEFDGDARRLRREASDLQRQAEVAAAAEAAAAAPPTGALPSGAI